MTVTYNALTGLKRKKSRRDTSRKKRSTLSYTVAGKWLSAQAIMACELYMVGVNLHLSFIMLVLSMDLEEEEKSSFIAYLLMSGQFFYGLAVELLKMDSLLMDLTPEDEDMAGYSKPLVGITLDSYDNDDHCQQSTRFTKQQILTIVDALPLGNRVYVYYHPPKYYKFNSIELVIYALRRWSTGRTHKDLCDSEFGGCSKRWACGYNYLLTLMDRHFVPLIGPRGLAVWAPMFPDFAEAIRDYITRPREKKDTNGNITEVWFHDYPIEPGTFNVFSFTDCTVYECCRPGSGPANSNAGSPRNNNWYNRQRAFYDGYHRGMEACLKILTIVLSNGITAAVYGPTSGRDDDRTLFRLAQFNEFLVDLCTYLFGGDHLYCTYGDAIFAGYWHCLRTAHYAPPGYNLTDEQESLNENMKSARECIEWSYARAEQQSPLLVQKYHNKLEVDSGRVFAETRMMYLFNNFHVCCLEGSTMTGERGFRLAPSSLEEYLATV